MSYRDNYNEWLSNSIFDDETKKELRLISEDEKEIEDRFYKELEFGTAGLRGIMGAGTNRMNKYTVGKATQGLANFIKKENGEKRGVVISYDSRNNSKEFSEIYSEDWNKLGPSGWYTEEEYVHNNVLYFVTFYFSSHILLMRKPQHREVQ